VHQVPEVLQEVKDLKVHKEILVDQVHLVWVQDHKVLQDLKVLKDLEVV
jgi:hypothetical protein